MNEITDRTPLLIATEINSIKEQTRKMLLVNSIEIGRRLVEAKSMMEHGQWGEWLEKSVDYSHSTANNLMKIYHEYGSNQNALFDNNVNSQAIGNLSYTQAVALLGIPEDEREKFVEENDVENMSSRELKQAIKEKQELEKKLKETEGRAESERLAKERLSETVNSLRKSYQEQNNEAVRLRKELEAAKASGNNDEVKRLQESLKQTENELAISSTRVKELEQQLTEKPSAVPVVEIVPEEIKKELEELRTKNKEFKIQSELQSNQSLMKFKVCFETLTNGFKSLLGALAEIDEKEMQVKYKNAVLVLIEKMSASLN